MGYSAARQADSIDLEPSDPPADDARQDIGRSGYDLAVALRIVRRMETSTAREAVFAEIKKKNGLYRIVEAIYAKLGAKALQPLLLFVYMLKCVLATGLGEGADHADAVSVSVFSNDRHSVERVAALVPDARVLSLSLNRVNLVGAGQLRAAFQLLSCAVRVWPFLSRIATVHSFMAAARIASALGFYIRFSRLFADSPRLNAAIVASNYSPEAVGLAAAAHRMGRRVIYINHAPVPANGAIVPPVLADCALFYGDAVRKTYERRTRCVAEVAMLGQPFTARPMQWRDDIQTVGIFLTALTRPDVVSEIVGKIRSTHPQAHILIRNHPVALLKADFSALAKQDGNLEVTIGNPLDDEILACDLIICGNSGVAMNALSGGRPVAYIDSLDELAFDYNGFVEGGLVCHVTSWSSDIYARLKRFYFNPGWQSVMRTYDASYGADRRQLESAAADIVRRYLLPPQCLTPVSAREEFPVKLRA